MAIIESIMNEIMNKDVVTESTVLMDSKSGIP